MFAWPSARVVAAGEALPLARLGAVPFNDVVIADSFWAPRRATNRLASIPVNLAMLEKSGNLRNFELAAAKATNGFTGPVFMDSDLYKALEAASCSLATDPDPELSRRLDGIIATIAAAQQPDGYLNTYFTVKEPDRRWANLRDWHELYCAGHLFEAAVAHFQATGKRDLLDVAIRFADHIDGLFGDGGGKRMGYPGHPEIELALVKLWRVTGERRYFNLARFFVEERGQQFFADEHGTPKDRYDGSYWQDDIPIVDHRNIKGHAVRACYLLAGATDIAAETADPAMLRMIHRVWRNTHERNVYITGGIGPSAHNEGFTVDYDLPNRTAYQETCATIALALWNHRLNLLYGDARYADVVERALYNGVLAGVAQDGTRFFYVNPLASEGDHHRSPWFGCACCPPNVARTLASLGGYAYAVSDQALWVNLFIQGAVKTRVAGQPVRLEIVTRYPWEGRVRAKVRPESPTPFELRIRRPGWCRSSSIQVNGSTLDQTVVEQGYYVVRRTWRDGDELELDLSMPVERIMAHPKVKADANRVALQRGPLVYCLEAVDHDQPLDGLFLPADAPLTVQNHEAFGGIKVIHGTALSLDPTDWHRRLYQPLPEPRRVPITALPYYLWDNREAGSMRVWLPLAPDPTAAGGIEQQAKVSVSFKHSNAQPHGINDGIEPQRSGEQPDALCHWWPHQGTEEWVQYSWNSPVTVRGSKVYWFDDSGRGACRLPERWRIEFRTANGWQQVGNPGAYAIARDRWCEVEFEPVTTTALRLVVKLQADWAAGIHEWKPTESDDAW